MRRPWLLKSAVGEGFEELDLQSGFDGGGFGFADAVDGSLGGSTLRDQIGREHGAGPTEAGLAVDGDGTVHCELCLYETDEGVGLFHGSGMAVGYRHTEKGETGRFVDGCVLRKIEQ